MATKSKAELRDEIATLAARKRVAISASQLESSNHLQLSELLAELEATTLPDVPGFVGLPQSPDAAGHMLTAPGTGEPPVQAGSAELVAGGPPAVLELDSTKPPAGAVRRQPDSDDTKQDGGDEGAKTTEQAQAPAPRPLPAGHKRPTIAEFVKAGYKAENYERHMAQWEAELTGSPLTDPPTPTVQGTDDRTLGGQPKPGGVRYRYPYTVAQGRSVTTQRRGTVPAFGRVRAEDFPGGQDTLDQLVASGHVVKT